MPTGLIGKRILRIGQLSEASKGQVVSAIVWSLVKYRQPLAVLSPTRTYVDPEATARRLLEALVEGTISSQEFDALATVAEASHASAPLSLLESSFGRLLLVNRRRLASGDSAITYQAAAAYLGVATGSVQRMVNDGTIPRLAEPGQTTTRTQVISMFAVADMVARELGMSTSEAP